MNNILIQETEFNKNNSKDKVIISILSKHVASEFKYWDKCESLKNVYYKYSDCGRYVILNYTGMAMVDAIWNKYETTCRGLVFDIYSRKIAARGFDKFFNWGEGGRKPHYSLMRTGTFEKLDGSLGILFYDMYRKQLRITTRGNLDSEQGNWATNFLLNNFDKKHLNTLERLCIYHYVSLMIEIIYPEDRHVVNYKDEEKLVLLGGRNLITGDYLDFFKDIILIADSTGFPIPRYYNFNSVEDIIAECGVLDHNHEGFVLEYNDGSRYKIKTDAYINLQRLISKISYKNIMYAMRDGSIDDFKTQIPDEFLDEINSLIIRVEDDLQQIFNDFGFIYDTISLELADIMDDDNLDEKFKRKEYAKLVNKHCRDKKCKDITPILFAIYDEKDYEDVAWNVLEKRMKQLVG